MSTLQISKKKSFGFSNHSKVLSLEIKSIIYRKLQMSNSFVMAQFLLLLPFNFVYFVQLMSSIVLIEIKKKVKEKETIQPILMYRLLMRPLFTPLLIYGTNRL